MRNMRAAGILPVVLLGIAWAGNASAGGLEANGYDWDFLFDPATYAAKGSATYVYVNKDIVAGGNNVASTPAHVRYNFGVKADLMESASCLASLQNPWGTDAARTHAYAASSTQAETEKLTSTDIGLTCSMGMPMGPGVVSIVGGISAQYLNYEALLAAPANISINGWGGGWRIGAAYEIPQYALRVTGIYNSAVNYNLSGTAFGTPATASTTTPQSFEVKAQSGIAEGWLALASVKWANWSVLQSLRITSGGPAVTSNFSYRDTWTLSGGIAHVLSKELTVLGQLTWDQGSSTPGAGGVLVQGTQTDRYGLTLGGAYNASEKVQITGALGLSALASGSNSSKNESWGTGYVVAVNGGIKGSF